MSRAAIAAPITRPYVRDVNWDAYKAPVVDAMDRLHPGDRVRFLMDYTVILDARRDHENERSLERVYAHRGEVARVIWAGRDRRFRPRGAAARLIRWRIGLIFEGETEPVFIAQRFYGSMEKV